MTDINKTARIQSNQEGASNKLKSKLEEKKIGDKLHTYEPIGSTIAKPLFLTKHSCRTEAK